MPARSAVWLLVLIGVGLGVIIVALSGMLGAWDTAWFESVLGNAGVTLFLAAPVALYLDRLSTTVSSVSEDVGLVKQDVSETKRDLLNLREETERAARAAQARQDAIYSNDAPVTAASVFETLEDATRHKLISTLGLRVEIHRNRRYLRFAWEEERSRCRVAVESISGDTELSGHASDTPELAQLLADFREYAMDRGAPAYDPMQPVSDLISQIRAARVWRRHTDELVSNIQEVLPGRWFIADDAVCHVDPDTDIAWSELKRDGVDDWVNHYSRKPWVEYKDLIHALSTAGVLLEKQHEPPF